MTYSDEVTEFKMLMAREFPDIRAHLLRATLSKLITLSNTLDKLAVAQCNGDWPADNGQRPVMPCPVCESGFVPTVIKKRNGIDMCPDCWAQEQVKALCAPLNIKPIFGGDPRGCVLKLQVPSGQTNDWGHEGICVPSRSH